MSSFIGTRQNKKDLLDNVIKLEYPLLNINESMMLLKYFVKSIKYICEKFDVPEKIFIDQLYQNNFIDSRGILNILLPHVDQCLKKNISTLNQIYTSKKNQFKELSKDPIKYTYSNIQYSRSRRTTSNDTGEIRFKETFINQNYMLLLKTIRIISNKLLVNWIDVLPLPVLSRNTGFPLHELNLNKSYTIRDKKLRQLYFNTKTRYQNIADIEFDIFTEKKENGYNGLYIGDVYNTIFNYLYDNIKPLKWLLYEFYIIKLGAVSIYLKIILSIYDSIDFELTWGAQELDNKNLFIDSTDFLIDIATNVTSADFISTVPASNMIMTMVFFFNKYYTKRSEAIEKGFIPINLYDKKYGYDSENDDIDDDIKYENLSFEEILVNFKSIKPEYLYDFLASSINSIQNTFYGQQLYEYGETKMVLNDNNLLFMQKKNGPSGIPRLITLKQIYNYCKSLVHYNVIDENGEAIYKKLPSNWESLSDNQKYIFFERLKYSQHKVDTENPLIDGFFNISGYFRRVFLMEENEIPQAVTDTALIIYTYITEIVMETMAVYGVLTTFTPNFNITDKKRHKVVKDKKIYNRKLMKSFSLTPEKKDIYEGQCNYFLTNLPYGLVGPIALKKEKKNIEYLDYLSDHSKGWNFAYALNWVSQINFYHHYINNRIAFITGSTGVGKSTEIPKLYLYSIRMINYQYSGSVVCTQPRINPTESVLKYISSEMGLPIDTTTTLFEGKEVPTNNFVFQYKHSKSSHVKNQTGLVLKFVTDGSFYVTLLNNIFLKTPIRISINDKKERVYSQTNVHDVVIVDEAHEHNINMDLVLSIMKYTTYYNNSIKFAITSATLEDDEGRYRNFYREINDNRAFPFSDYIKTNELDRINVDRRIHISPPGQTTSFKINMFERIGKPIKSIVDEILSDSVGGDILIFQPGKKEISDLVSEINSSSPNNVIALPYYSELTTEKKNFIETLTTESKKKLDIPKTVDYTEKDYQKVEANTYNRVIIVATNIAEASITINTLRYVIDDGTRKIMEYNYLTKTSILKKKFISGASMKQREGRVGRVASGNVYKTYSRKKIIKNKPDWSITISDIHKNIYGLIRENVNESKMFSRSFDVNYYQNIIRKSFYQKIKKRIPQKIIEMVDKNYLQDLSITNIANIDTYTSTKPLKMDLNINSYFGQLGQYDYFNDKRPSDYYETGFSIDTILDRDGTFYNVHLDENDIVRNVYGDIVSIKNSDQKKIVSKKIISFLEILQRKLYIILSNPTSPDITNRKIIKTNFGIYFDKFITNINIKDDISERLMLSFLYSIEMKHQKKFMKTISMLSVINNVSDLASKKFKDKQLFFKKYKNISDINALDHISNNIIKYIRKIGINVGEVEIENVNISSELGQIYMEPFVKGKSEYLQYIKHLSNRTVMDTTMKMERDTFVFFEKMNQKGIFINQQTLSKDEKKELLRYKENSINVIENILESNYDIVTKLNDWCQKENLNPETVIRFIDKYSKNVSTIKQYQLAIYDIDYNMVKNNVNLKDIVKNINLPIYNISEKYKSLVCLFYGFGSNIVKTINTAGTLQSLKNKYFDVNYPDPNSMYTIKSLDKKNTQKNTLVEPVKLSNSLFFIRRTKNNISIVCPISINFLQIFLSYIYTPQMFKNEIYKTSIQKEFIKKENIIDDKENITDVDNKLMTTEYDKYLKTVSNLPLSFVNYYRYYIWYHLKDLNNSLEEDISYLENSTYHDVLREYYKLAN